MNLEQPLPIRAAFNPAVKTYLLLYIAFILFVTIIGIPFAIIWLCGVGQWWAQHYFDKLECDLTERTLHFKQGIFVQVEKTIPLENIQDLTFIEGPILRAFNLCMLKIETAGKGDANGFSGFGNEMSLIGVIEAQDFRSRVLSQRQAVMDMKNGTNATNDAILVEIRDLLREIAGKM